MSTKKKQLEKRRAELIQERDHYLAKVGELGEKIDHFNTLIKNIDALEAVEEDLQEKRPWWKRKKKPAMKALPPRMVDVPGITPGCEDRVIQVNLDGEEVKETLIRTADNLAKKSGVPKMENPPPPPPKKTAVDQAKEEDQDRFGKKETSKTEEAEHAITRILEGHKELTANKLIEIYQEMIKPNEGLTEGTLRATISMMNTSGKIYSKPGEGRAYLYTLEKQEEPTGEQMTGLTLRREIMETIRMAKKPLTVDAIFTRIGSATRKDIIDTLGELKDDKKVVIKASGYALTEWFDKSIHVSG